MVGSRRWQGGRVSDEAREEDEGSVAGLTRIGMEPHVTSRSGVWQSVARGSVRVCEHVSESEDGLPWA